MPILSNEELQARVGKLTASRMVDVLDFRKDGQPGADRKKYLMEIVAERLTDVFVPHYVTPAMQWGIDNELLATIAYIAETGVDLLPGHYVDHPAIDAFGATPDALHADPHGLVEFKCPTTTVFVEWMLAGVVPEQHKPQMTAQLLCTGRRWCDFCAFDPRMPEGKRLLIRRFEPTPDERVFIEGHAIRFLAEVDALFETITIGVPNEYRAGSERTEPTAP